MFSRFGMLVVGVQFECDTAGQKAKQKQNRTGQDKAECLLLRMLSYTLRITIESNLITEKYRIHKSIYRSMSPL